MASFTEAHYASLTEGLDYLWSNKFAKAEEVFAKRKETSSRHALHYAETLVFRAVISELAAERQGAIERLNKAISLATEEIKTFEQGKIPKDKEELPKEQAHNLLLDSRIVLADSYTILASLQIADDSRIKGILNLRRAWRIYRDILTTVNVDPAKYDPVVVNALKFGAGLFYFIISLIPPGIPQKAAAMAGFKGGDKELGLSYLRDCYASNSVRSFLAGFIISMNNLVAAPSIDPKTKDLILEAEKIVSAGISKYPEGSIFQAASAVACLEVNKPDEAIVHVTTAIDNCKNITAYPVIFLRLLSNCYSMKLDWKTTAEVLGQILQKGVEQEKEKKSRNPWAYSWNTLRLGACYIMLNEKDKAKSYFEATLAAKSKDRWSQMLAQQAQKYTKNGGSFSFLELMHLQGFLEKLLNNSTPTKREDLWILLENLANDAPGAQDERLVLTKPAERGAVISFFSKKQTLNEPNVDNRAVYLVYIHIFKSHQKILKGMILRSMDKRDLALKCFKEIVALQPHLVNDKMYYAMALVQVGKTVFAEDKADAISNFEAALKLNGFSWENPIKTQARIYLKQLGVEYKPTELEEKSEDKAIEDDADIAELLKEEQEDEDR